MIDIHRKIKHFKSYLVDEPDEYRQEIKNHIYEYFFEILGDYNDLDNFYFLKNDLSLQDVEKRVDLLISKIIMHEHHDGIQNIIEEYSLTSKVVS